MAITRRQFAGALSAAPLVRGSQAKRPNILWITCEDMGPHLHACGDAYSVTPNLDRFAAGGSMYLNAWSNAPVCAPARTTIISGLYPPSTGAEHMRSMTSLPEGMKLFPGYLRDAGYYCTNNDKEDYNLVKPPGTWDDSSKKAHWRNRAAEQPFFSIFNFITTHESQIRKRPHTLVHDPAKARVPAYHPDTAEVRHDWAQYYDNITTMDAQAGRVLAELAQDRLVDDTIVLFYGDHGSGMPRGKRWPYNSGLNVSIVVSIPEKLRHLAPKGYVAGGKTGRLVGFVDLAPTMLSLAGLKPQPWHQGQAFLGPHEAPARRYVHGFRGRMDERIDCVRTVRDDRYVYVKNYMPHKIYGQHLAYMWETPTTRVWKDLYDQGKLNDVQRKFWEPKPAEELFELKNDPDEVKNLAGAPEHKAALDRLRAAHREHTLKIRDIGLLPESEIHERAGAGTPYEAGHDAKKYPLERVLAAAELASSGRSGVDAQLVKMLGDADSGVRYWAAMGLLMRKSAAPLVQALADSAAAVRIVAAEAVGLYGSAEQLKAAMFVLLPLANPAAHGAYVAMQALNAIDTLGAKAKPWRAAIAALPNAAPQSPERVRTEYIKRLREHIDKTLA
ncbi:MAG: sulfatase-like hydrolase/transferase [Bryobacterales bacterium]|nr:sulfatase-like hydrolase/transferase [Bryobacterales bacterium]